jgi:hypothetical protein
LVDDSISMTGSRWNEARDALAGLVKTALKYDEDGVEIFFLNAVDSGQTVKVGSFYQAIECIFNSAFVERRTRDAPLWFCEAVTGHSDRKAPGAYT